MYCGYYERFAVVAGALSVLTSVVIAADGPRPSRVRSEPSDHQAMLERQFKEAMTDVVLEGTWRMARGKDLDGRGPLSPPKTDRYTVKVVKKIQGDQWIIGARVQYMDKDVMLPVPVRVIWADDTPVITLDPMDLPGLGRYSARVMIHRGYYSGIWHGTDYGGVLSGRIIKNPPSQEQTPVKTKAESKDATSDDSKHP